LIPVLKTIIFEQLQSEIDFAHNGPMAVQYSRSGPWQKLYSSRIMPKQKWGTSIMNLGKWAKHSWGQSSSKENVRQ